MLFPKVAGNGIKRQPPSWFRFSRKKKVLCKLNKENKIVPIKVVNSPQALSGSFEVVKGTLYDLSYLLYESDSFLVKYDINNESIKKEISFDEFENKAKFRLERRTATSQIVEDSLLFIKNNVQPPFFINLHTDDVIVLNDIDNLSYRNVDESAMFCN